MKRIYLDYNATAPVDKRVQEVLAVELRDGYGNASSLHEAGRLAAKKIREARERLASLVKIKNPDELIFTSGGSESNNTVFWSIAANKEKSPGRDILISAIEHPCVLESAERLKSFGFKIHKIPVDGQGLIDMEEYSKLLKLKPRLVSIMAANNEIGTVQDIKKLSSMAHEAGAYFHSDCVQAVGKIPVDAGDWGLDYMSISAHKIYGPKGVGALYVKKGVPFASLITGGHQENGHRAGTYNSPGITAFGVAASIAEEELESYRAHVLPLRNKLRDGLVNSVPNIRINGSQDFFIPNTLSVSFPGAEGEAILLHLDLLGIEASTGSACASGSLEPSHVLVATGLGPELAHGSIRFSLGKYTTEEEIDYVLKNLPPVIEKLRKFSTVGLV